MFRNTAYGNKWFYAFLDSADYINDNCSEINCTIDVMQTWAFDYTFGDCFVEREHSITDEIGDNIIPEDFNIGEYISTDYDERWNFSTMLGAVITSKKLPDTLHCNLDNVFYDYYISPTFIPEELGTNSGNKAPCGIPNGVYTYCGFPVSAQDVNETFWGSYNQYNMQDFFAYVNGVRDTSMSMNHPLTLPAILDSIGSGIFFPDLSVLSVDDIVAVYVYPAILNYKGYESRATGFSMKKGTAVSTPQYITRPSWFYDRSTGDNYTPRNNKLFTYPYIKLHIFNINGDSRDYIYEDFEDLEQAFQIIGSYANKGIISIYPTNYKGVADNYEEAIQIDNFPSPAYKGDQFARWFESNKFGLIGGIISGAITGSYSMTPRVISSGLTQTESATRSLTLANNGAFLASGSSGQSQTLTAHGREAQLPIPSVSKVISTISNIADMIQAPPKTGGEINADILNIGANRLMFMQEGQTIKPQIARIIDDYFTMYGYATKRVKKPNIVGNTYRRYFNYVKTINALIKPAAFTGLPADDIKLIQDIYDKGITFWNNMSNIGDYSLNNDIITV
jgi:hypothetical protein